MSLDFISVEAIQEIAKQYGYGAVFLGILLENLGLPIPGETVTIVGGFLAGSDQLTYWGVLGCAALGATLGGNVGYGLGRWGGWALLVRVSQFFRVPEAQVEKLRTQFSQNAAKAVFVGRFLALFRVFASPLAGITEMPFLQFTFYNTLGAVTWASVMVSGAYFIGQLVPLEKLLSLASQFSAAALVITAAVIGIPIWLESRKKALEPTADPE
jgi:membrane protein DedA with SNARE-associated domain